MQVHDLAEQIVSHRHRPNEDATANVGGHGEHEQERVSFCADGNQTKENSNEGSPNKNGVQHSSNSVSLGENI